MTTTFLQQERVGEIRAAAAPAEPAAIVRVDEPSPEFARFLFTAVGGDWYWLARLGWSFARWTEWLSRPGVETWVAWLHGTPAGYIELDPRPATDGTDVEIACFGLLPRFHGRGLGGQLLTAGLRHAWSLADRWPDFAPINRVWVHTCTLDGEHALANYRARGLRPYRTEQADEALGPNPPGPWPGAHEANQATEAIQAQQARQAPKPPRPPNPRNRREPETP